MNIIFNPALNTHVALDDTGYVLGIYRPERHGSLSDFLHAMTALYVEDRAA